MARHFLKNDDPLAARIREAAGRGALSHALLLTGSGDGPAAANYAAAAMECESAGEKPCGVCAACRKVYGGIHPDVMTVEDPEHKEISVDVVRRVRTDAYIRPNEGRRKIYIFPDCSILTERDQNVLLKIVEEGPPYAAFLFCADSSAAVLATLRSRCVEWKLTPSETADPVRSGAGDALCAAIAEARRGAVAEAAVRLEKKKPDRDALCAALERSCELLSGALLSRYTENHAEDPDGIGETLAKNLTKVQIMRTIELLQKYRAECSYHVGVNQVLGALAVELEEILWQK